LRSSDVHWSERDQQELLANADTALDRLTDLVTNLLDLSRLQAGALPVIAQPVGLDDVVSRVLDHVADSSSVKIDIPENLPEVAADAGLLERAIANLIENAVRYNPPTQSVHVTASAYGPAVELRVIDTGPGIPPPERDRVFAPFQRHADHADHGSAGVGLGLAIARGFVEAMHGTLTLDDTPGGGLTAVVALPAASPEPSPEGVPTTSAHATGP
jgi:two-component system sensor histidine kinase KdpD